jgi:serine/threonine protein kinase
MSTALQSLGKYELQDRLGTSGIAEIWKAFDPELQRAVALKIFHADLQNDSEFITSCWRLPLIAEAQLIVSLRHPNIVHIHGFQIFHPPGSEISLAYMVMDYIEGLTLIDYIRNSSYKGEFPAATDLVLLFTPLAPAIDYAHQKDVIHGNITPGTILLDKHNTAVNPMGEPMFTDFGITEQLGISVDALSRLEPDTPSHISSEQAQGHPANELSDMYALGVILYEICTAELPFQGEDKQAILTQYVNTPPPSPSQVNSSISPALSAVILRSLARGPADSFSTAASMVTELARALNTSVPVILYQPEHPTHVLKGHINLSPTLPSPSTKVTSFETSSPLTISALSSSEPFVAENNREGVATVPPPTTLEEPSVAYSPLSPLSAHGWKLRGTQLPTSPLPATSMPGSRKKPPLTGRSGGSFMAKCRNVFLFMLTNLLAASTPGALFVFEQRQTNTNTVSTTTPIVGHVYFLSSDQLHMNNIHGIDDQVPIDLRNLAAPASGRSYYGWLLGDMNQSEVPWVALGKVSFNEDTVHFLFPGDKAHTNLLNDHSLNDSGGLSRSVFCIESISCWNVNHRAIFITASQRC